MEDLTNRFFSEMQKILSDVSLEKLQNLDFSSLSKIYFENSILYYIVGFLAIIILWKLIKFPIRILKKVIINSICGYFILYILMMFKIVIVPFTYLSYFLVGSFGIIGIIISYIIYL